MHRPLLLLGLLALTAACVDTTYATRPDVLHPGPCAVEGLTLRYDDRDRLVEVREADGKLRERYTYEDDFTLTIEVNTTVYYDPTNSQENLDSVVPVEAKLYAHATIDPVTFEFLISRIDATLPAPYQAGSGQIFYTYTDDDEDGWAERTEASFLAGWKRRVGSSFIVDLRRGFYTEIKWIPKDIYASVTGEEIGEGDVLMIRDFLSNGLARTSFVNIFQEDKIALSDFYILGHLADPDFNIEDRFCSQGLYGITSCNYIKASNDYSPAGNPIRSRREPLGEYQGYDVAYDYTCWTSADVCTKWRYVPSGRHITSTSLYPMKHGMYLGIPSMIRMPCEWSWETAARLR